MVPGWTRFAAAEDWLNQNRSKLPPAAATRDQFEQFLAARRAAGAGDVPQTANERALLFQEFTEWQARQH
jgi:uncharacterized protein